MNELLNPLRKITLTEKPSSKYLYLSCNFTYFANKKDKVQALRFTLISNPGTDHQTSYSKTLFVLVFCLLVATSAVMFE